jgi:hypothetical protein
LRPRLWMSVLVLLLLEPVVLLFPQTSQAIPEGARTCMILAKLLRGVAHGDTSLGVSAPPNFGSAINYAAGLPSVTNAFFYPKYLQSDLRIREFTSTADLIGHLRRMRIGYLIAVDDARYRTMLLRMVGRHEDAGMAKLAEQAPCQGELLRFAFYRLACAVEMPAELKLLLRRQTSAIPKRLFRRLALFGVQSP